jgi:hypothetical protein
MRGRIALLVCFLLGSVASRAQWLKSFHDPNSGVGFFYPAAWSNGPEVSFYLDSEITTFDKTGPIAPRAKVGFVANTKHGEYAGTNLSGVQFVYNEIPDKDAAECRKRVTDLADDQRPADTVTVNGIAYTHYLGGDAGLGHGAERKIYSTYREGRCVLFEESMHTFSMDDPKALSDEKRAQLWRQLDAVMQSVRFREEGRSSASDRRIQFK